MRGRFRRRAAYLSAIEAGRARIGVVMLDRPKLERPSSFKPRGECAGAPGSAKLFKAVCRQRVREIAPLMEPASAPLPARILKGDHSSKFSDHSSCIKATLCFQRHFR